MKEYEPTSPHENLPAGPGSSMKSQPSTAALPSGDIAAPLLLPTASSASVTMPTKTRSSRVGRLVSNRRKVWIMATALMLPVVGISAGLVTSPSARAARSVSGSTAAGGFGFGGGGINARSGPASGGVSGPVPSVSKASFTVTTSPGQKVTVDKESSTRYLKGTSSTSASAIAKGKRVLVFGTTSGMTIKATQVIVQATGSGSTTTSAAKVIPFQRGAPTTSKQVGQIPANWSQGSGTIVSGTAANKATEAALAAYSGGVVDRVVKLSNGEYNVHFIGVNWPHHVFVNQDFTVVGAE